MCVHGNCAQNVFGACGCSIDVIIYRAMFRHSCVHISAGITIMILYDPTVQILSIYSHKQTNQGNLQQKQQFLEHGLKRLTAFVIKKKKCVAG